MADISEEQIRAKLDYDNLSIKSGELDSSAPISVKFDGLEGQLDSLVSPHFTVIDRTAGFGEPVSAMLRTNVEAFEPDPF